MLQEGLPVAERHAVTINLPQKLKQASYGKNQGQVAVVHFVRCPHYMTAVRNYEVHHKTAHMLLKTGRYHLAAWKVCKALPVIKKPSIRQPRKSHAQTAADKKRKEKGQSRRSDGFKRLTTSAERSKNATTRISNPAEAARLCRNAKSREEKVLIVLKALVSD
ncbi:hypothetical protein AVEN_69324-1 [Araneus ventricosus]|uniref:Uncharacterized protein n=1 Tax=Araneus ventricosus TaxID=182803 RepID=A0A4Y2K5W7_ARAVE|nr:hypothetical protein AVEN_69324-1 [Araneus ventricosus]